MNGWGIEPETVHNSGSRIWNLQPDMESTGNRCKNLVADCANVVFHPQVAGALTAYASGPLADGVSSLVNATGNCGWQVGTTATTCVDGENESTAAQAPAAGGSEDTCTALNRAI